MTDKNSAFQITSATVLSQFLKVFLRSLSLSIIHDISSYFFRLVGPQIFFSVALSFGIWAISFVAVFLWWCLMSQLYQRIARL